MKQYLAARIRNIALTGHSDSGKTSLTEALLYKAGATDRLGKVSEGNTVSDYDPEEVKRQVSVSVSVAPFAWGSTKINLIDTPGLFDFAGETGNINKLYRLADKKDKKLQRMPIASLQELYDELSPLTPEQRMKEFSLKADRADVIVPAAKIFLTIAETVKAHYVHVPVIGLADGVIDSLYADSQLTK